MKLNRLLFGALPRLAVAALSLSLGALPAPALADGPGLPNLSYSSAEVFRPLTILNSDVSGSARGHGTVQMVNGYLFVPFGRDSGASGGGFAFYDMSNPRAPVRVSQTNVTALREPHGFGFSNSYPGRYVVMQAINGIQFWDITNERAPTLLRSMTLPGIAESDYALGAWWVFWQAPYVYVGGSGNGIYVVDATDPRNPTLVTQVSTGSWGGFRVGPVFAVGNLLVAASNNEGPGLVTLDISNPRAPSVIASTTAMAGHYSAMVNGERVITAGIDNRLHVFDITNPAAFPQLVQSPDIGGRGGYVSTQRGFAHAGFSNKYAKVNIATGAIVGTGTSNIANRDEDFGTVFGNLVLVGNDHGNGSALMPHQTGPITGSAAVNMVSPKNNATNQALTSRVGITTTDQIDLRTVSASTFIVRPLGGSALAGKYSGQSGILNFSPDAPLLPGTTYEVVVPAGGMKDDVGIGVAAFTSRFTTAGTAPGVSCTLGTRTPALVGSTVSFSPASVSGANLQYAWNFGDGTSTGFSSNASASRVYTAPAHYPVVLTVRSGTVTGTCSATQTVHTQPTATAPRSSSTIAFDAGRNRVWVVNSDNDSVTAINAANNTRLFEQAVGLNPQTLAQAPDGRIWVTNQGSGSISVLDPSTGAVVQTIQTGLGSRPFGVVFSPLGTSAFVSLQGSGRVLKLHPSTGAVQGTLTAGSSPRGLAISGDSNRLLVTRYISPVDRGEVVEVNTSAFVVTRTFTLATDPGPDTEASGRGVPNFLSAVTIQPDGKRAWIPSKKDNTLRGSFRDGNALTFESTVRTIVSQIDLDTNAEVLSARVDLNDRDMANAVAFSPLGDYAFISTQGTNQIEVMDAYNRQLVTGIVNVGRAPRGLLVTPNGRLYVQNFMSRNVGVYDVSGLLSATSNTATKLVDIAAVSGEALPANVFNGKRIFYNADDRRMNRDKYISCASCHQDGGHDGRTFDFTDRGEGLRNNIALNGRRGMGHGRVHWTGNFNEIQDFEHDIRGAFGGTGFLTDAQFNTGTRNQPLGDNKTGLNADLDALAAYVSSLNSVGRSPFRNADGSLTTAAVAGQQIFNGSGQCATCHSGTDFTDSPSGVLRDVGTIKASSGRRLGATLTGFDTPTLKGLWDTAPYLHDGSAATLRDVLTTANPSGRHGTTAGLSATQLDQLVAYLQQIDDGVDATTPVNITNLSARDTANAADWSIQNSLQNGAIQYGDRTYALTTVPSVVLGGRWIRTANDSKSYTGDPTVSFNISQTADVYIAIDDRVGARPWMTGWTNTGQKLVNNEGEPKSFTLFRKNFPAGAVSLGPSTSAGSMYTVIVK